MSDIDPYATIADLFRAYRARELSAADVVEAHLAREDRLEPKLRAYVTRYSDEAREKARSIAQSFDAVGDLPVLAGVPIALKDLVDMEGRITSGGSPERAERVSPGTAVIAQRLISAGAIVSGKTHTVEMATGGWGTNEHLGAPWNPWDLEVHRTPGGSSSGSGVAVAAGYCPGAIGTDTGGSVRLPAGWCGLVGLKVTEGTLPIEGILPLSFTLDTPGPMTRSVDDALLMFEVLRGSDPVTVGKQLTEGTGPFFAVREPIKDMRFAVLPDEDRADVDGEMLDAYDRSVDDLADLGAEIVVKGVPTPWDGFSTDAVQMIIAYEGYRANKGIIDDDGARMDQWVKRRLVPGRSEYTETAYRATLDRRKADLAAFAEDFREIDAILTPTTLTPAIPLTEVDEYGSPARFTRAANYLALCSLAIPNGFTKGGLPTSLMITCHGGQEITALRIGKAYEASHDWTVRHPEGLDG